MQSWLLLVHDGVGSVNRARLTLFPGRRVASPSAMRLHSVQLNGHVADEPVHRCVLQGLALLARTFKDHEAWPLHEVNAWHLESQPREISIAGRSHELLMAMCTYIEMLAQFGGNVRDARVQPRMPFAATGELGPLGWVQAVNGVSAKLDAALAELSNSVVFLPLDNWHEVTDIQKALAKKKGVELQPTRHLHEALQWLGVTVNGWWQGPPWRALGQYQVQHQPIYFGRSAEAELFVRQLLDHDCSVEHAQPRRPGGIVVAASGTGKSSFVQAGVLARLRLLPPDLYRPLHYSIWRPRDALGDTTISLDKVAIASSIARNWTTTNGENATGFDGFDPEPAADLEALADRAGSAMSPSHRYVWVVDQLEELFTLGFTRQDRIAFARFLRRLQRHGIWIIASLRSEFYADYQELKDEDRNAILIQVFGGRQFDLPDLSNAGLHEVIHGPASAAGLSFESAKDGQPNLETVLFAAAARADSAPLLSYAMHEMWEYARTSAAATQGDTGAIRLTFKDFRQLGNTAEYGIKGVIGSVAEETFTALDNAAKRELRRLLEALSITITVGDGKVPAARPAALKAWPSNSPGGRLVQQLKAKGLIVYDLDRNGQPHQMRVAHEVLFEGWTRAKEELEKLSRDAESRRQRRRERLLMLAVVAFFTIMTVIGISLKNAKDASEQRAARTLLEGRQWVEAGQPQKAIDAALASMKVRRAELPGPDEEAVLLRALLTLKSERALPHQKNPAAIAQISHDGQQLLTASRDGDARVIHLGPDRNTHLLPHEEPIKFARFFDDGQVLTATDGKLRVWSKTAQLLIDLSKSEEEVVTAFHSESGQVLLSARRSVRLLDLSAGKSRTLLTNSRVRSAAFNKDGTRVVTSEASGTAILWQLDRNPAVPVHAGSSASGAMGEQSIFSIDGRWLAVGFGDRTINVCRIDSDLLTCHRLEVARPDAMSTPDRQEHDRRLQLSFSKDGARLHALVYSDSKDSAEESGFGVWKLIDSREPEGLGMLGLRGRPTRMALSRSGDRIVFAGNSHLVQILDLTMPVWDLSEVMLFSPEKPGKTLLTMFEGPSVGDLAFLDSEGEIISWDPEPRYPRRLLVDPKSKEKIDAFTFLNDGRSLLTLVKSLPHRVDQWSITADPHSTNSTSSINGLRLKKVTPLGMDSSNGVPNLDPDPTCRNSSDSANQSELTTKRGALAVQIAANGSGSKLRVRRLTGEEWPLHHSAPVQCVTVSNDGRYVATADEAHVIYLWDLEGEMTPQRMLGHRGRITDLAFSPDSTRLVTSSEDATVRLWMIGAEAAYAVVLEGHNRGIKYTKFNVDGSLLGTLSHDGQLRIWETPSGRSLLQLAQSAHAKLR